MDGSLCPVPGVLFSAVNLHPLVLFYQWKVIFGGLKAGEFWGVFFAISLAVTLLIKAVIHTLSGQNAQNNLQPETTVSPG